MEITLRQQHFDLLPQRAIYWKEQQSLVLSDLHLGKGMHFRKEGIPIPKQAFDEDLNTLNSLIVKYAPKQLIVVGDMFHSRHNNEVKLFDIWRVQYPDLRILLVKGNHDILKKEHYRELDIEVVPEYETDDFVFTHDSCDNTSDKFCFSGHLHPGVAIRGMAKQSLKFPCFHFTPTDCTLPAFSKFTGLAIIKPKVADKVFAIVEDDIVKV